MHATALQLSDIACRMLHTLYSNSVIALTQFPGDMPPASRTFRAAVFLLHNAAFRMGAHLLPESLISRSQGSALRNRAAKVSLQLLRSPASTSLQLPVVLCR